VGTSLDYPACFYLGNHIYLHEGIMTKDNPPVYGYCPMCGKPGLTRQRRPNGNDMCGNGHTYPSSSALSQKPKKPVKKKKPYTKKDIEALVKDLFTNGMGQTTNQIILVGSMGNNLGGWCQAAMVDRIMAKLNL